MKRLYLVVITGLAWLAGTGQTCTPLGDETSYGTGDVWIGYLYDNLNFTGYAGYVNEGVSGNPNFNQTFGGDYTNYSTNGCPVLTETFSVRYKLRKNFTFGNYQIVVGADDGYRLSLDGGATWVINRWFDQGFNYSAYSATLSGNYDIVLEYYENGGQNRVSFSVSGTCLGPENPAVYGTGNTWNGYIYTGKNFDTYSGKVTEGSASSPNFDENFGGDNVFYPTSSCNVLTEQFSARYRLQYNFPPGSYSFIVGGDDGYRFSLDGGATWVINQWGDHSYFTSSYTASLSGLTNMVLEYYENGGQNRISFAITGLLPIKLNSFSGYPDGTVNRLHWTTDAAVDAKAYSVERSTDGNHFSLLATVDANAGTDYRYTDPVAPATNAYYRLRMLDADGRFSYSSTLLISRTGRNAMTLYPTVTKLAQFNLYSPGSISHGRADLLTLDGRKLQSYSMPVAITAGQTTLIPFRSVPAGAYLLLISNNGQISSRHRVIIE